MNSDNMIPCANYQMSWLTVSNQMERLTNDVSLAFSVKLHSPKPLSLQVEIGSLRDLGGKMCATELTTFQYAKAF